MIMRIAQVVGKLSSAGVEAVVNNYCRMMNHDEIQFDYFIDSDSDYLFSKEMEESGARYYVIPPTKDLFSRISALTGLFRDNGYRIVHSHMNTLNAPVLYAAKRAGVPVRISHNHSMADRRETGNYILKLLLKPTGKWFATHYMACGEKAGEWYFGKNACKTGKVFVLPNAIDIGKYRYNPRDRAKARKDLGIEDCFVIGHVGRFVPQKNHGFLIRVFSEIRKNRPDARLLLIGDGPLREDIKRAAEKAGIQDAVIFLGSRKDVSVLYNAMDAFALPSLYEGVPVVGLEAQANGLPCVFSDNISEETKAGENTLFLPLSQPEWIRAVSMIPARNGRADNETAMEGSRYDIRVSCSELEAFYHSVMKPDPC